MPPSSTHKNIARGRRFSISSRSRASSFGFSAERNASAKNSAFIAGQPASVIVPRRYAVSSAGAALGAFHMSAMSAAIGYGPRTR